jgi:hypothetical protein
MRWNREKKKQKIKRLLKKRYGMKTKLGLLHRRLSGRWEAVEEETGKKRKFEKMRIKGG